jgi:uncharacterized glyoxalase superfamily protein PhnB
MATTFDRVAPVFPVRNVRAALAHYQRLGFVAKARTPELRVEQNSSAVYVYVDDADALWAEWQAAAPTGGRFLGAPEDTPYHLREFAYVDPDGNLLRIGSEMKD